MSLVRTIDPHQLLDKTLRNKLERTVKEARDVAEEAARAACKQLGVGMAKPDTHLTDEEKGLRRRLRIHGRQLGDERDPKEETQQLDRLVEEIAYEHWHRMLFARFLAENHLLMYPDPDDAVSVSIDDCNDLAADEGARNGWELAARFATRMLPQIFRVDSPVFSLTLPPENQQQLERLLAELPDEVFTASDSLGWVYQFWQAEAKKRINESEVKIGARELPAVTQLFTEPYMVSFLLDNSLGAWWAARRLTEEDFRTAASEQELRDKAALPGVPLDYLRFVWVDPSEEVQGAKKSSGSLPFDQSSEASAASVADVPCWRPAAGTFDAWPESLSELKTLDPCCGSGHFLVAALLMLTPIRMELEGLSAREAVDRVLSENLHGLEIDQRCVELAAFALALTAWRFPDAGGYRPLPDLNVACCGLSVSVAKEEWKKLAGDDKALSVALDWMYDQFKDAPVVGSLFNPLRAGLPVGVHWKDIGEMIDEAHTYSESEERYEIGVVAHGLSHASVLLGSKYDFLFTNVPYKKAGETVSTLQKFIEDKFDRGRKALETAFLIRCVQFLKEDGYLASVTPQNWTFLTTYEPFRKFILNDTEIRGIARLGAGAFQEISGEVVKAILILLTNSQPEDSSSFFSIDTSTLADPSDKANHLVTGTPKDHFQAEQKENPDHRISIDDISDLPLLAGIADTGTGIQTFDSPRFLTCFWEHVGRDSRTFMPCQSTVEQSMPYDGRHQFVCWENGSGGLAEMMKAKEELENYRSGIWRAWSKFLDKKGVCVSLMGSLPSTLFDGMCFDNNTGAVVPNEESDLPAVWAFCESADFNESVRKIDQKMNVTNATLAKIPFDLSHWQQIASEQYPHGLPQPHSDDPTQWIFHGHPASSDHALQVAVARLLGYRWPAELDAEMEEMELADDARVWVERSSQLTDLADNDGIVCIPAVGTEHPAEDRLLNLLHKAYEGGRAVEQQFQEKLDAGDTNDSLTVALLQRDWQPSLPGSFNDWQASLLKDADHAGKTLGSWLRDKFFTQHCKLFHHRPFIWYVWDGLKDGFSVLINYHKLDNKLLKTLIYTYLNDWINRQKQDKAAGVDGSEEKLAAAVWLKERLEQILKGESPHDIFVRWKPLDEQPIGWNPDLNDGVRLNIRPWMTVDDVKKKGAGLLRDKPNIHWKKDRGKDVESAPWYRLGPKYDGKEGDRINDHHLALSEKNVAREKA